MKNNIHDLQKNVNQRLINRIQNMIIIKESELLKYDNLLLFDKKKYKFVIGAKTNINKHILKLFEVAKYLKLNSNKKIGVRFLKKNFKTSARFT